MTTNRWCLGRGNALNKVNGQLEPLNQSHTAATVASSKSFRDNCRQRGVERGGLQPFGIHQHVGQIDLLKSRNTEKNISFPVFMLSN